MIRTDILRSLIQQNGMTQAQVARRLGMTTRTFYSRMKLGVFRSDEMEAIADMLKLQNPMAVFFCKGNEEPGRGRAL